MSSNGEPSVQTNGCDLLTRSERLRRRRLEMVPAVGGPWAGEQGRGWGTGKVTTPPSALVDLISSIGTSGVLQPILCEQLPDAGLRVVSGHRRLAACRWGSIHLGATAYHRNYLMVPAVVVPGPLDEPERRAFQLIENLGRVDLAPGELAAAMCYERAAVLAEALTELGHPPPEEVANLPHPIGRWDALDEWRRSQGLWNVGAPWPEVISRLGIELNADRCRLLVRAFRTLPTEISAQMDNAAVALNTRQRWLRLWRGRPEAAQEIWEAVRDRNPALLSRAITEAEQSPNVDAAEVVDTAQAAHDAANEARSLSQRGRDPLRSVPAERFVTDIEEPLGPLLAALRAGRRLSPDVTERLRRLLTEVLELL